MDIKKLIILIITIIIINFIPAFILRGLAKFQAYYLIPAIKISILFDLLILIFFILFLLVRKYIVKSYNKESKNTIMFTILSIINFVITLYVFTFFIANNTFFRWEMDLDALIIVPIITIFLPVSFLFYLKYYLRKVEV